MIRCQLFHMPTREVVCLVELDEDLLRPEAEIIDPETMSFKNIKNGKQFTVVPIDDHKVAVLKRLKSVYTNITTKPIKSFSTSIVRADELLQVVGLMFGDVEYFHCQSNADFEMLINPRSHDAEKPPVKKYNVLGDMLAEAEAEDPNVTAGVTITVESEEDEDVDQDVDQDAATENDEVGQEIFGSLHDNGIPDWT